MPLKKKCPSCSSEEEEYAAQCLACGEMLFDTLAREVASAPLMENSTDLPSSKIESTNGNSIGSTVQAPKDPIQPAAVDKSASLAVCACNSPEFEETPNGVSCVYCGRPQKAEIDPITSGARRNDLNVCAMIVNDQQVLSFVSPLQFGRDGSWAGSPLGPIDRSFLQRLEEKHDNISRKHLVISTSHGRWSITDLGSTNGTFLNNVQLKAGVPHTLDGDSETIRLGSDFLFRIELNQKGDSA